MSLVSIYNQIASSNSRHASASASGHAVPVVIASAAIGHEDLGEHGTLTIVLIRLLDDAAEAIYRDREAARTCIGQHVIEFHRRKPRVEWDRDHAQPGTCIDQLDVFTFIREEQCQPVSAAKPYLRSAAAILATRSLRSR